MSVHRRLIISIGGRVEGFDWCHGPWGLGTIIPKTPKKKGQCLLMSVHRRLVRLMGKSMEHCSCQLDAWNLGTTMLNLDDREKGANLKSYWGIALETSWLMWWYLEISIPIKTRMRCLERGTLSPGDILVRGDLPEYRSLIWANSRRIRCCSLTHDFWVPLWQKEARCSSVYADRCQTLLVTSRSVTERNIGVRYREETTVTRCFYTNNHKGPVLSTRINQAKIFVHF